MKAWDAIDRGILQEAARTIATLPRDKVLATIREAAERRCPQMAINVMRRSFANAEPSEVLGVAGACLLIHHHEVLESEATFSDVVGIAAGVEVDGKKVPHVFLFAGADEVFVKHEKIHVSQMLSPDPWPLKPEEHSQFLSASSPWEKVREMLAGGIAPEHVASQLVACVTRMIWCELEAYWFAQGAAGVSASEVLSSAYRSAKPIEILNGCAHVLMESGDYALASSFNETLMTHARTAIPCFCEKLELEVPWIRDLLSGTGHPDLYTALWDAHERFEDLTIFGSEEPGDWELDELERED